MSTRTPDTAPIPHRKKRLIASMAAIAITAGGGAVAYKELSGNEPGHKLSSVTKTKLPPTPKPTETSPAAKAPAFIEKLPGYGNTVTEQERAMVRASTVKIAERDKGDATNQAGNWHGSCTGIKSVINGSTYIVTARHCFGNIDMNKTFPSLNNSNNSASAPDLNTTKDITKDLSVDVGVWTTSRDGTTNTAQTVPVEDVSVRYYPDIALLKVNEAGPAAASFDALPSIPYESLLSSSPKPGAEVAISSLPDAAGGAMVESTGWYLGRVYDPGDPNRQVDLVGVNPSSPAEDGCNFGASGSVAVMAGGTMTGPLSTRNNISNPVGTNGEDDPAVDKGARKVMAAQLGYTTQSLDEFATICSYTVVTPNIVQHMAQ
ncbi:MAG: hypothetical protein ACREGB_03505 [Candidatus Saccharimonadales bacterium]